VILRTELPDEVVEAIAERAAEIVLSRLADGRAREPEFLTVTEAAELLRCSRQRIYDLCSDGRLTRFKEGSRVLLARAEIVALLRPSRPRLGAPARPRVPQARSENGVPR
jgi:excisionase family DNA binding protein